VPDPFSVAPVQWGRVLAVFGVALILSHLADGLAWEHLRDERVNDRDWGRWLRTVGYLPAWVLGALALWLTARPAPGEPPNGLGWRAGALVLSPALAGGLAELVKLTVRRQRPGAVSPEYLFRPFDVDLWSTRGLGFISSHTAVAFGAAALMARAFPGSRAVWYTLAAGCAVTRVMSGAHYLSDVVGAAVVGWLVAEFVWRWAVGRGRRVAGGGVRVKEHAPL
jgi:membrane-associated phospholipid phosphatase